MRSGKFRKCLFGIRVLALMGACVSGSGCSSLWDTVTSREFRVRNMFQKAEPPLVVLEKSVDGDKRAAALAELKEPLAHNGTVEDQEKVFKVLSDAALTDRQALCRIQAISTLRNFKDTRAPEVLKDSYYRASNFNPETATVIKCQALDALGTCRNPAGMELLVKVLKEPTVVGSENDRQQKTDEKIIAAKSLGYYKDYQASESLLGALQTESDVALKNTCKESLTKITGKDIPADYEKWAAYLHQDPSKRKQPNSIFEKMFQLTGFGR